MSNEKRRLRTNIIHKGPKIGNESRGKRVVAPGGLSGEIPCVSTGGVAQATMTLTVFAKGKMDVSDSGWRLPTGCVGVSVY